MLENVRQYSSIPLTPIVWHETPDAQLDKRQVSVLSQVLLHPRAFVDGTNPQEISAYLAVVQAVGNLLHVFNQSAQPSYYDGDVPNITQ